MGCVGRRAIGSRWLSGRRVVLLAGLIVGGVWALPLPLLFAVAVFVGGVLVAAALTSPRTKLRWRIVLSVVAYIAITAFALHPLSLLTAIAAAFVGPADACPRPYPALRRRAESKACRAEAPGGGGARRGE